MTSRYKCYWCDIELILATEHGDGEILLLCPQCERYFRFDECPVGEVQ